MDDRASNAVKATVQRVDLYAAGSNTHGQLFDDEVFAHHQFRRLIADTPSEGFDVAFAGWCSTFLAFEHTLLGLGDQVFRLHTTPGGDGWNVAPGMRGNVQPAVAFGTHDGAVGFIDQVGRLVLAADEPGEEARKTTFVSMDSEVVPALQLVAIAGNDRVVCTFRQAPNSRLCHVVEFETFAGFLRWVQDPSAEGSYPDKHHMLPGRPKRLLANIATFLLLMEDSEVYSWGDPRHLSLGRSISSAENATPAEKPGLIEALGGLRIGKIASGGWLSAALSEDGALYLWGTAAMPGSRTEKQIRCLAAAEAGQVVLVEIAHQQGSEPLDVLDVGIGSAHVLVVVEGHRLFGVGDNGSGQLGLAESLGAEEVKFAEDWTELEQLEDVQRVVCGPKTSFVFVNSTPDEHHT